jgi:hypothetical protein
MRPVKRFILLLLGQVIARYLPEDSRQRDGVRLKSLPKGTDLVVAVSVQDLKRTFHVAPDLSPNASSLRLSGSASSCCHYM